MTVALERRYARLLWLYPADYRRDRGPELLDTLMAGAEPGSDRPSARETTALLVGALRTRAGTNRKLSVRENWLSAVRAAVLMLLVSAAAHTTVDHLLRRIPEASFELTLPGSTEAHLAVLVLELAAAADIALAAVAPALLLGIGAVAARRRSRL